MQARIELFTAIELYDPNGLMHVDNQTSLNRLFMIGSNAIISELSQEVYQNLEAGKEFDYHRVQFSALEELIDAEYCRCALAPGLLDTQKTQRRLDYLHSQYRQISKHFTPEISQHTEAQLDKHTQEKLQHEFAQTVDSAKIIRYTFQRIETRLQRLAEKCIDIPKQASITRFYQDSLAALWEPEQNSTLSIAPWSVRLDKKHYESLSPHQKTILGWSLHIANLAACFDSSAKLIDRQRDILRGIAAMRGQTLPSLSDSETSKHYPMETLETFGEISEYLSDTSIEDVIWVACSVIRELNISSEHKKLAWSSLESVCKNSDVFSRHISFESMMEILQEELCSQGHDGMWKELPEFFAKSEALFTESIDYSELSGPFTPTQEKTTSLWCQHAEALYRLLGRKSLTYFSLLSVMSSLKLASLHLANKQSIFLYCKLFTGDYARFSADEKTSYQHIVGDENKKYVGISEDENCRLKIKELYRYLQKVTTLLQSNPQFHASFAEGIVAAMPMERAEQLVTLVRAFTKGAILCTRLSSHCPDRITITFSQDYTIWNTRLTLKQYYTAIEQGYLEGNLGGVWGRIDLSRSHSIMPGGNFNHKVVLADQEQQHTKTLNRYVRPCTSLACTVKKLDGAYTSGNSPGRSSPGLFNSIKETIQASSSLWSFLQKK